MKKRNSNEEKLSNVVNDFIDKFGLKKRFQEHEILQAFSGIM
jgi:mRNA-degrading endonuclease YafQ of YafQ-DinJ toxin-antitoxin module